MALSGHDDERVSGQVSGVKRTPPISATAAANDPTATSPTQYCCPHNSTSDQIM
jgi:hypothetical protein